MEVGWGVFFPVDLLSYAFCSRYFWCFDKLIYPVWAVQFLYCILESIPSTRA